MTLKSNPNELNISDKNLFDKLIDINNFEKIINSHKTYRNKKNVRNFIFNNKRN